MSTRRIIYPTIAILFGIFFFIYGEYDDSPGGQLLGFLMVVIPIIGLIRNRKKKAKKIRRTIFFLLTRVLELGSNKTKVIVKMEI